MTDQKTTDTYPISLQTILLTAHALTAAAKHTGLRHQCGLARACLDEELPAHLFGEDAELPAALPREPAKITELVMSVSCQTEPAANIEVERDVPPISIAVLAPGANPHQLGALDCYQAPGVGETLTVGSRRWLVTRVHWASGRVAEVYVEPPADGWDGGKF